MAIRFKSWKALDPVRLRVVKVIIIGLCLLFTLNFNAGIVKHARLLEISANMGLSKPFDTGRMMSTDDIIDNETVSGNETNACGKHKTCNNTKSGNRTKTKGQFNFQPLVNVIESYPARKGFASISFPNGSIWCDGNPTYWITGHQKEDESPYCKAEGKPWQMNTSVALDVRDLLNGDDIDRHYCVTPDVNRDGIPDLVCSFGANLGKGVGYNELYITQQDGTLLKIQKDHGLQKYPTMRNRYTVVLKNYVGNDEYVFFGTKGVVRSDGQANGHRLYRNIYRGDGEFPYFWEIEGPWNDLLFETSCAVAGDFNGDQRDDLIVCAIQGPPLLILQFPNDVFTKVNIPSNKDYMQSWRNVRIVNVVGDSLPDLVVVTWANKRTKWISHLYIFRGIAGYPYFDFDRIHFQMAMKYSSPDVEVLDINNDNKADIYVVQIDEVNGYCAKGEEANIYWGGTIQPPIWWTPPIDKARDVLLLGTGQQSSPFNPITLQHAMPGCGWIAQRWDDQTMLLGQGSWDAAGHSLLLKWG